MCMSYAVGERTLVWTHIRIATKNKLNKSNPYAGSCGPWQVYKKASLSFSILLLNPVLPNVSRKNKSLGMGDISIGCFTPLSKANSCPPAAEIAGQLGNASSGFFQRHNIGLGSGTTRRWRRRFHRHGTHEHHLWPTISYIDNCIRNPLGLLYSDSSTLHPCVFCLCLPNCHPASHYIATRALQCAKMMPHN